MSETLLRRLDQQIRKTPEQPLNLEEPKVNFGAYFDASNMSKAELADAQLRIVQAAFDALPGETRASIELVSGVSLLFGGSMANILMNMKLREDILHYQLKGLSLQMAERIHPSYFSVSNLFRDTVVRRHAFIIAFASLTGAMAMHEAARWLHRHYVLSASAPSYLAQVHQLEKYQQEARMEAIFQYFPFIKTFFFKS
jgi:hypothetical protein